ncbi:MAG: DUF4157 domain-containing protein [Gemmatimonadota bacterium]
MIQRRQGPVASQSPGQRVGQVLSSPGRPLRPDLASLMGAALRADFSAVRIHDGPGAAASARAVGASMYTSGTHVVVGDAHASFDSITGRRALAHELYHVKQQSGGPVAGTPTDDGLAISDPSDPYERAAQRAADQIGNPPGSPAPPGNPLPEILHAPASAAQDLSAIPVQRDTETPMIVNGRQVGKYVTKTFDGNRERPSLVTGPVRNVSTAGRGVNAEPIAGKLPDGTQQKFPDGYARGHVLGLKLGGENIRQNVVPMFPRFNTGPWSALETRLKDDASKRRKFEVTITVNYPDQAGAAAIPDSFPPAAIPDSLKVTGSYDTVTPASASASGASSSQPSGPSGDPKRRAVGERSSRTEEDYEVMRQPHGIPQTLPLPMASIKIMKKNLEDAANAAANALERDDATTAGHLRQTGHLPKATRASYPDEPHDRPYEYLDILELAGMGMIPKETFSDGREFSSNQRKILLQANMAKNGGTLKSDDPEDPQKVLSEQGTVNVPEIDHIIPKSLGGSNLFSNARVVSWQLNNRDARIKPIGAYIDLANLAPSTFPRQVTVNGETVFTMAQRKRVFLRDDYLPRQREPFTAEGLTRSLIREYAAFRLDNFGKELEFVSEMLDAWSELPASGLTKTGDQYSVLAPR